MSEFAKRFEVMDRKSFLKNEDKQKIHDATLNVMEDTGIRVHSAVAREALKKAGAEVDETSLIVKFPCSVTVDLMKKIPKEFVLAGRTKEYDILVNGTHHYYTTDGCGIFVWDEKNQKRRDSVLEDVRKTAIIGDWLPYLSIYEPVVVANDIPSEKHVIAGMKEAMENTSKHIETESTTTAEEARAQVKMAAEVVGSVEELRKRHYISAMVCTVPPLILDGHATDAAMIWAENHIPVHITAMSSMGLSGPATIPGELIVCHAETLALACAMQAHDEGAPVLYGSVLSTMDLRSGGYNASSPEASILGALTAEMAIFCNIPNSCGGIGSSSRIPGVQAAMENAIFAPIAAIGGSEIMNGIGLVDGSTVLSYEQLLIDHEIAALTINSLRKIEVDDETLAVDIIKKVGIGGNYLKEKHTLKHTRDFYISKLIDTSGYESWVSKGSKTLMDIAGEKADWILKNHQPEKLDRDISTKLEKIVKEF